MGGEAEEGGDEAELEVGVCGDEVEGKGVGEAGTEAVKGRGEGCSESTLSLLSSRWKCKNLGFGNNYGGRKWHSDSRWQPKQASPQPLRQRARV